jgi:murein DD-endopeptidase MepM/ murein hydrolase activator NlpD
MPQRRRGDVGSSLRPDIEHRARHAGLPGAFGNNVQVQIGDLWVRSAYLESVLVSDGDQVASGTVLGPEGSTGPHLHFEVDAGCPIVGGSIDPSGLISLPVGD